MITPVIAIVALLAVLAGFHVLWAIARKQAGRAHGAGSYRDASRRRVPRFCTLGWGHGKGCSGQNEIQALPSDKIMKTHITRTVELPTNTAIAKIAHGPFNPGCGLHDSSSAKAPRPAAQHLAIRILWAGLAIFLTLAGTPAQSFSVVSSNLWYSGTKAYNYSTNTLHTAFPAPLWNIENFFQSAVGSGYGVIALQEVYDGASHVGGLDVTQHIQSRMGDGWTSRFGGLMPDAGGSRGNAVVTNATVVKNQYWQFAWDSGNLADYGSEQRGAVATKLDFGGRRLWFISVHLAYENPVALAQVFQLLGKVKTFDPDSPVIVAGDLNIRNRSPGTGNPELTYHKMAAAFGSAGFEDVSLHLDTATRISATPSSATLNGQLDYIYLYDPHNRLTVTSCTARWVYDYPYVWTDHRALLARMHWN